MSKRSLFVANWKMNFSFDETLNYVDKNKKNFIALSQSSNNLILCPSFIALNAVATIFTDTPIAIGAQNVSAYTKGAFTGEVDAESIKQVGCTYALVGHSEQRRYASETDHVIAEKTMRLIEQQIMPIVCVGEDEQDRKQDKTFERLVAQLAPIFARINTPATIIIAYEPVWAIGTGMLPSNDDIGNVFAWIFRMATIQAPHVKTLFLYGGSVTEKNASRIMQTAHIDGLLIGSASLDFQKFKSIVSL